MIATRAMATRTKRSSSACRTSSLRSVTRFARTPAGQTPRQLIHARSYAIRDIQHVGARLLVDFNGNGGLAVQT